MVVIVCSKNVDTYFETEKNFQYRYFQKYLRKHLKYDLKIMSEFPLKNEHFIKNFPDFLKRH